MYLLKVSRGLIFDTACSTGIPSTTTVSKDKNILKQKVIKEVGSTGEAELHKSVGDGGI